jgi:hypothetical protein
MIQLIDYGKALCHTGIEFPIVPNLFVSAVPCLFRIRECLKLSGQYAVFGLLVVHTRNVQRIMPALFLLYFLYLKHGIPSNLLVFHSLFSTEGCSKFETKILDAHWATLSLVARHSSSLYQQAAISCSV